MPNDKRIRSCLSRFDSGAYSRLQFLRAVCHSVGAHTESLQPRVDNSSNSNSSEDEDENRQAPVPAALTSGASKSRQQPRTTCKMCIMAPRAGFALVPCGHRTRKQYTRRRNDDKKTFRNRSISQSHNRSLFYYAPKRFQRAGQLSLLHAAISKTEKN